MHELHFRVDDVLYNQLSDLALVSDSTMSKFLTKVLRQYVDSIYCYSQIKPLMEQIQNICEVVNDGK